VQVPLLVLHTKQNFHHNIIQRDFTMCCVLLALILLLIL
jgi:hypothetical protein